jgi:hypothetical protein
MVAFAARRNCFEAHNCFSNEIQGLGAILPAHDAQDCLPDYRRSHSDFFHVIICKTRHGRTHARLKRH